MGILFTPEWVNRKKLLLILNPLKKKLITNSSLQTHNKIILMAQQDLSKLIKRLELIKNLISLEEDDEINEHLNRLKLFIEFKQIEDIVNLLNNKEYLLAVNSIDNFLLKYNQVSVYIDFEADSLKLEVKALETNINKLCK